MPVYKEEGRGQKHKLNKERAFNAHQLASLYLLSLPERKEKVTYLIVTEVLGGVRFLSVFHCR